MGHKLSMSESARFVMPVIAENAFTVSVSLIYSAVTGAISAGSLAAATVGNQAMNMISALFAALSTGSAILTARLTGKQDEDAASRTVEQTLLLTPVLSILAAGVLLAASSFLIRLLMPGAEGEFLQEGSLYFRVILLSVPFTIMMNASAGMLRAAGQSRVVLVGTVISNAVQLAAVYLLASVGGMGLKGVALATVICRAAGCAYLTCMLLLNHRGFRVSKARIFHPDKQVIRRIFSVGLPASVDSIAVQLGYVVINSLLVNMGRTYASVVSVLNSVLVFTGITQGIGAAVSITLVGHKIGAGDIPGARRTLNSILLSCELSSFVLCVPAILFSGWSAGLFSKDADVILAASSFMWIQIPYCFSAVGVNVCEPAVRVGGDVKYAMINITVCVLLIRLPLTYLFCIRNSFGVAGIYAANITSLTARFAVDYLRIRSEKWGKREL